MNISDQQNHQKLTQPNFVLWTNKGDLGQHGQLLFFCFCCLVGWFGGIFWKSMQSILLCNPDIWSNTVKCIQSNVFTVLLNQYISVWHWLQVFFHFFACAPGGGGMPHWGLYIILVNHFLKSTLKHKDSFGKSENLSIIFFTKILVFDHDYEGKSSSSNGLLWISFIFFK